MIQNGELPRASLNCDLMFTLPQSYHYRRFTTSDGNFVAEHLYMRNPEDDVALTDGDGYMVGCADYEQHLREAPEVREVYCCTYLAPSFQAHLLFRNPLVTIILL